MTIVYQTYYRMSLLCIIAVFLCSCASRQWISPDNYELSEGNTVYRVITEEADTITFAGSSVESIERNFLTGEEFFQFNGEGAVFNEGIVRGVSVDGSEEAISILDTSLLEVDMHDTCKTVLYTSGILAVSSLISYLIIKGLTEKEPVLP